MTAPDRFAELLTDFELSSSQSGISRTSAGKPLLLALTYLRNNDPNNIETTLNSFESQVPPCRARFAGSDRGRTWRSGSQQRLFFRTVEALAPNFDILCLTGDLARHFGFLEITVKAFDRAMEIVPHVSHALLRRGQTFSEAGDCSRRESKGYPAATEPVCRPRRSRRRISVANMTDAACNCYHTALDIEP